MKLDAHSFPLFAGKCAPGRVRSRFQDAEGPSPPPALLAEPSVQRPTVQAQSRPYSVIRSRGPLPPVDVQCPEHRVRSRRRRAHPGAVAEHSPQMDRDWLIRFLSEPRFKNLHPGTADHARVTREVQRKKTLVGLYDKTGGKVIEDEALLWMEGAPFQKIHVKVNADLNSHTVELGALY
eukprot:CAMPEP_0197452698 /NCGR_PEP_ID=MMETSP1175-20131217/32738_1 /TAXON_ID=1003142 /ORGANISM="Triceratium dubium, Strain CCMP147" /LENGTH=178 /DNA_ID=CAMNT_0042985765 /DNA_START=146 /DNA_END=680 /DNA_ORIENTATION=-